MSSRSYRLSKRVKQAAYLLACAVVVLLPWRLRRLILIRFWKYDLAPTSHIGIAWVFPGYLVMGEGASIGHLTVCKNLEMVRVAEHASIGRGNWISGYPRNAPAYRSESDRRSELILDAHSAVTNRHIIDCTNAVTIGAFATVAGYGSQFLTHSIDLLNNVQRSRPIHIGRYCFVGTKSVVLGGSTLPDYCVLGANSLLNKPFKETLMLYGGVPAKPVSALSLDYKYFTRETGFVL